MSQMFIGSVGLVWSEKIGIWGHRLKRSSYAGHVEVTWILDVETCEVLL